ncbi:ATP-grasp domain-containing protein [Candidatus Woesearchaeota archaeon]|nr:ATP-grasp domain-containing protein [Candidatus Woesearchaeota archaeon]
MVWQQRLKRYNSMQIAVIYNLVEDTKARKEEEKIADNEILVTAEAVKHVFISRGHDCDLVRVDSCLSELLKGKYDCIFNLAEGIDDRPSGEAEIAELLEKICIPFTGNNSNCLSTCLDKKKTKEILVNNKITTPNFQIFQSENQEAKGLMYPLIVKPVNEDASIGITLNSYVVDAKQLKRKVKEVLNLYKQPALVEEFIDGREINAALIGTASDVVVLPLSEIIFDFPKNIPKFLPFEAKWIESSVLYKMSTGKCPAEVNSELRKKIEELAIKCFKIMKCKGYARVDFRVKDNEPYVLEVNPNPGINPHDSGFVRSAKAFGYSFEDLILKIFSLALDGGSKKQKY